MAGLILGIKTSDASIQEIQLDDNLNMKVAVTGSNAQQFETLTIDNTVTGVALTAATYGTHKKAFITVETAQIRYRVDGQAAPSATLGHLLNPGEMLELDTNEDIVAFRAIRTGATSATVQVSYSD
jgi:hypothetical protein